MFNPPHPGLTLRDDVLPALGLSVTEAAQQLDVARVTLSRVLNGRIAAQQKAQADDRQRREECSNIRNEIARQQGIGDALSAQQTSPMMATAIRTKAQRNIADLESRAADVRCNAAFSNAPV
jgi:hypothetical protein